MRNSPQNDRTAETYADNATQWLRTTFDGNHQLLIVVSTLQFAQEQRLSRAPGCNVEQGQQDVGSGRLVALGAGSCQTQGSLNLAYNMQCIGTCPGDSGHFQHFKPSHVTRFRCRDVQAPCKVRVCPALTCPLPAAVTPAHQPSCCQQPCSSCSCSLGPLIQCKPGCGAVRAAAAAAAVAGHQSEYAEQAE
jgi:hypothetical protein